MEQMKFHDIIKKDTLNSSENKNFSTVQTFEFEDFIMNSNNGNSKNFTNSSIREVSSSVNESFFSDENNNVFNKINIKRKTKKSMTFKNNNSPLKKPLLINEDKDINKEKEKNENEKLKKNFQSNNSNNSNFQDICFESIKSFGLYFPHNNFEKVRNKIDRAAFKYFFFRSDILKKKLIYKAKFKFKNIIHKIVNLHKEYIKEFNKRKTGLRKRRLRKRRSDSTMIFN